MEYSREKRFSFISDALPEDAFGVVKFTGMEGLSKPYEFEILVASERLDIPLEEVIKHTARLIIHREKGDDAIFQGLPMEFEQLHAVDNLGFYQIRLAPKLQRLSLIRNNQVILGQSLPDFIAAVLKDGGLTTMDFEFRLQSSYPTREFICQYGESHLDFISRWLEREGIYYFFEQGKGSEKVIFTDTAIGHRDLPQGKTLSYHPATGLETGHRDEVIGKFLCRQRLTPEKVFVKEYNEMKPSLTVSGSALAGKNGFGQVYYYHEHFQTPEEGNHLAKIRAEALLCMEKEFRGESFVPYLAPGFTFTLEDHFRGNCNQSYLTTEVRHRGSQAGYMTAGIGSILSASEKEVYYGNEFSAIPAAVQYRPELLTPRPRIAGTISAHIDAEGSGKYAELDDHGRYHIVLPFDLAGRPGGKASAWVRMAQPYAGPNHGMHFPLHKGTEVLLTFIDGDPDRPVIAAAIPNVENRSVVSGGNAAQAGFTTAGGSSIHTDDTEGQESLVIRAGGDGESGLLMVNDSSSPSGSGMSTMTNWQVSTTTGSLVAGAEGIHSEINMFQKIGLTGFLPVQAVCNTVGDVIIKRLLPLGAKSVEEASGREPKPSDKASVFSATMGILMPIMAIVAKALPPFLLSRLMKKAITNKGLRENVPRWGEILENSGYQVACGNVPRVGSGVVIRQGWFKGDATDKSISLVSGSGPIMTYSQQDTHIVAEGGIAIASLNTAEGGPGAGTILINGRDDIAISSEAGGITIDVEDLDETLSLRNREAQSFVILEKDKAELSKMKMNGEGGVVTCKDSGVTLEKMTGTLIPGPVIAVTDRIVLKNENKDEPFSSIRVTDYYAGIHVGKNEKAAVRVGEFDVRLEYNKNNKIIVDDNGVHMKIAKQVDLAGQLKINKNGKVTIG